MRSKGWRKIGALFAFVFAAAAVGSYSLITDPSGYIVSWQPGTITMKVKLPTATTLNNGSSQSSTVQAAMSDWNTQLGTVQFAAQSVAPGGYADGNYVNEIVIADRISADEAFDEDTLAVTLSYRTGNWRDESDITFNSAMQWNSYSGPVQAAQDDMRRVALHELGHVLGLGHPDLAGQAPATTIMNSYECNIDALTSDDIAGAQSIYGSPGFVPSNDNSSNATVFSDAGGTLAGQNIAATAEAGEQSHGGEPARRSVWWKWTATNSGTATFSTQGSNFDTVITVYSGVTPANAIANNNDADGSVRTSAASFQAAAGTTYFFAVDGWNGYFGQIQAKLAVPLPPSVANGIAFGANTLPGSVPAGSTVNFNYTVTNSGTKTWGANHFLALKDGANNAIAYVPTGTTAPGASKTVSFTFTAPAAAGSYTYKVQAMENGVEFFGPVQNLPYTVTAVSQNGLTFGANTFPPNVAAGGTVNFTYTVTNSGTKSWGANHYLVLKDNAGNSLIFAAIGTTAIGASKTVSFSFPAPASAGSYTYKVQALENGVDWFGAIQNLPLTVTAVIAPNAITYNSNTFPPSVAASSTLTFNYTVTNSGTKTWGASHYLVLKDSAGNSLIFASLATTAAGVSKTVSFTLPAPTTAGSYSYTLEALENGVAWFGAVQSLPLSVTGLPPNAITYNSNTFPTSVSAGGTLNFNYTVTNSGTKTWGASHYLVLKDSAGNGLVFASLATTAAGASKTVNFTLPAPTIAGSYTYKVEALENGVSWFGVMQILPLDVTTPIAPNAIKYDSNTFPTTAFANATETFLFTVKNSGTKTWGANHYLVLKDGAGNNLSFASLSGTAAGAITTVSYTLPIPAAPGSYTYQVQALENGVEWFGAVQNLPLTVAVGVNGVGHPYSNTPGNTFPASVMVGTTVNFSYKVSNYGTKTWGANHYLVLKDNAGNSLAFASLATTQGGRDKTVSFTFPAPTSPGSYVYTVQALENGVEWFGAIPTLGLDVSLTATNGITYNSNTFPVDSGLGAAVSFNCTVTNSGTRNWGANHYLVLKDNTGTNIAFVNLATTLAGASKTVSFTFTAPATAGTYTYKVKALENGVEFFGVEQSFSLRAVGLEIFTPHSETRRVARFNDLQFGATNFPASADADSSVPFSITVTNTGTKDWAENHYLVLKDQDLTVIGYASIALVPAGGTTTVDFVLVAPRASGDHLYFIEAEESGVEQFGDEFPLDLLILP